MDILKAANQEARLSNDLLRVIDRLGREEGGLDEALRKIRKVVSGTADEAARELVQRVLDEMGIPLKKLQERFEKYADVADLLLKPLSQVTDQPPVALPIEADGSHSLSGGELAVEGAASLSAMLEADFDGEAIGERIRFQESEALLRYAIEGKLKGKLSHDSNLGSGNAGLGIEGGASVLIENYFRHSQDQQVLGALLEDLASFRLPGEVDESVDLRHRTVFTANGQKICIPDQWIHVEAHGNLDLSGKLSVSQGTIQTGIIKGKSLSIDEEVAVAAGLHATAAFSKKIEGSFDILLSHSEQPGQLRVEIGKTNASERQLGLEIGASVGVEGLDGVANAVLKNFLPKVTSIIELAEEKAGELPSLRSLFSTRIEEEVGDLLASNEDLVSDVEALLKVVKSDVDLKARLVELATEAVLKVVGDGLDDLDQNLEKLKKLVAELAEKYRSTLKKLQTIMERVADIKIGIGIAFQRQRNRGRQALLTFRIDPDMQPRLLRKLLLGDIQPALDAAQQMVPGVVLEDGVLVRSGRLAVSTSFSFTMIGLAYNHGRILEQEWEERISPTTGDVALVVRSSLKGVTQTMTGRVRTLSFLANADVLATTGQASALLEPRLFEAVTLSLTEFEKNARTKRIERLEKRWQEIGILPPGHFLEDRLLAATSQSKLNGPLTISATMELGTEDLERLTATPSDSSRRVFAECMIGTVAKGPLAARIDGRPLLLDPGVEEFLDRVEKEGKSLLKAEQFSPVPGWSTTLTLALDRQRHYLRAFDSTLSELGNHVGSLAELDSDAAIARILQRQRRIMKAAKVLVTGELAGDGGLGYAYFKAIATLSKPGGASDSLIVAEYGGKTLVFA